MKTVSLSGSLRENVGKKDAKKVRNEGQVPCVLYGGKEQKHFSVSEKVLVKAIWSPHVYLFNLTIDGKEYRAIVQDLQFHPVKDCVLHVDFLEVNDEKPFMITLPVKPVGVSAGVQKGGRLVVVRRKLKVKGLLADMPETVDLDITNLEVADSIKVAEIQSDKLSFLDPASSVVLSVKAARNMAEDEEENEDGESEE